VEAMHDFFNSSIYLSLEKKKDVSGTKECFKASLNDSYIHYGVVALGIFLFPFLSIM